MKALLNKELIMSTRSGRHILLTGQFWKVQKTLTSHASTMPPSLGIDVHSCTQVDPNDPPSLGIDVQLHTSSPCYAITEAKCATTHKWPLLCHH